MPSLNDCLETGPNLLPKIFEILLRNRFKRYIIVGDIQKAFHQIEVDPEDRDAQRVLWYDDLNSKSVKEYRFTRVIFGATSSPYILNATVEKHLDRFKDNSGYADTIKDLQLFTYVDDVSGGGDSPEDVKRFKREASTLLKTGGFHLYKWNSNVPEMDDQRDKTEAKVLGIQWDKTEDHFRVNCDTSQPEILTKRKMLASINATFDPLGWAGPYQITAKLLFGEVCRQGASWDEALPETLCKDWLAYTQALKRHPNVIVPRAVCTRPGSSSSCSNLPMH